MLAVLNTNVIVSRHLSPQGPAAQILSFWRSGAFDLLVSEAILQEIHEVLLRPKLASRHRLTTEQVGRAVANFRRFGVLVAPTEELAVVADDPDDDKFLECAAAGSADVIVSGDPHLLALKTYRGIRILSPAAFANLLTDASGG